MTDPKKNKPEQRWNANPHQTSASEEEDEDEDETSLVLLSHTIGKSAALKLL